MELSAEYSPLTWLNIGANATFSKNRLKDYTLYTDTYDNSTDWGVVPQTQTFLKSSKLTLSPEIIAGGYLKFTPCSSCELSLNGKFVGKQYVDNSSSEIAKVPSYFIMGANISKRIEIGKVRLTISGCIDNILDRK